MKIINKEYNIKGNVNTNIVLISDIHYHNKKDIKHLNKVLDKIKYLSPKYVCIPGDLIDEAIIEDEDLLIEWLNKLSMHCKVVISLGNHEFYYNKKRKIYRLNNNLIKKISEINNLYLLNNKNILIDNINFIGFTMSIEEYNKKNNNYKNVLNNFKTYNHCYNILLCHSPIPLYEKQILLPKNINLVLCGHMHGGVTPRLLRPIFKNRGIVSPSLKLFPKVCYGHLRINNTDMIITSGITVISNINKFRCLKPFFPSEIVNIKIDT